MFNATHKYFRNFLDKGYCNQLIAIKKRLKHREEALDRRNSYGTKDLTPYNAVLKIRTNGKSNIVV